MAIFLYINALVINFNRLAPLLEHAEILSYNRLAQNADYFPTHKRNNVEKIRNKYHTFSV